MRRARKPLVVLAPKTLLRLPAALSPMEDFALSTRFTPVLENPASGRTDRILFCTGKIAYELERERARRDSETIAIVRLERIYPFPEKELADLLARWPDATIAWVQEEPENMGVWRWIQPRLDRLAEKTGHRAGRVRYHGRAESPSPAGSYHGDHEADQAAVVASAFEPS
jgi:2-oxoglutarate dehydrogenase E1 component